MSCKHGYCCRSKSLPITLLQNSSPGMGNGMAKSLLDSVGDPCTVPNVVLAIIRGKTFGSGTWLALGGPREERDHRCRCTYAMNEQTVGLYSPLNKNQKEEEEASTSFMSTHVGRGKFPYCGVWRACGC
ncbi:hypothetical protein JHK82_042781 [Glycine max]|nr:hypothetical protein JHK86_042807 [Glycine max]KAG4957064.1 hypothetical protein JHK85_043444 [Glycine max]KAG5105811.1 hypothetical protein JHK82_042781 [Glycine max]